MRPSLGGAAYIAPRPSVRPSGGLLASDIVAIVNSKAVETSSLVETRRWTRVASDRVLIVVQIKAAARCIERRERRIELTTDSDFEHCLNDHPLCSSAVNMHSL